MINRPELTGKYLGILFVFVAFLISGCKSELKDEISATGTVEMTETTVSSKQNGRITRMFFEEGQTVKAGELMAELEHEQLNAQIEAARSNLQVSKVNLNAARRDLNRLRKLIRDELISQAEYDKAVTGKEVYEAQVRQGEANLSLLEVQLEDTKLRAPAGGFVSAKLAEPGEIASLGSSLYTILDQSKPWVKIYLPLKEVEQVNVNQLAVVNLDAFPNFDFIGRVSHIAREAEFTPKDYLSKEERVKQVYEVKIDLDNSSGKLKAGIPAEVRIKIAESDQVDNKKLEISQEND